MNDLFIIFNVALIFIAALAMLNHEKKMAEMRNKERKIKMMQLVNDKVYEIKIKKLTGNGEVKK